MTDFSKTGSRNMAETRSINFLTLVSYSTSIVIGDLRRLLLAVLMWDGVDLEYFRAETAWSFQVFFPTLIANGTKLEEREFWFWNLRRMPDVVFNIYRKLSVLWRITPLGGAKYANFFKMGKFKRSSLTHRTTQGHQIFRFTKPVWALVDYQVLSRSLRNLEILRAKFRKIAKKSSKFGVP